MPLGEYLRKHTHRQHLTWLVWLAERWNRPDRTDHYLMQLCAEVRRLAYSMGGKKGRKKLSIEEFKLKFGGGEKQESRPAPVQDKVQATTASKAKWLGMMTMPVSGDSGGLRSGKPAKASSEARPGGPLRRRRG